MTVEAGRRYRYRYWIPAEDRQWSSWFAHENGPNRMAADNSVLHLTAPQATATPVEGQPGR